MTASEAPQCAELPIALTDRVHLAFRRVAVGDSMSLAIKYISWVTSRKPIFHPDPL